MLGTRKQNLGAEKDVKEYKADSKGLGDEKTLS